MDACAFLSIRPAPHTVWHAYPRATGERRWEAEVHWLKGELLWAWSAEHHAEAETCMGMAAILQTVP